MIEYEEIGPLPRWAYTQEEWTKLLIDSDKIVDGHMYSIVIPEPDDIMIDKIFEKFEKE